MIFPAKICVTKFVVTMADWKTQTQMKTTNIYYSTVKKTERSTPERGFSLKVLLVILAALVYGMSASA
jgi:hypothetical protein